MMVFLINNSVKKILSSQKTSLYFMEPKVYFCFQKILSLVLILSLTTPVHILKPSSFKVHFNNIFPLTTTYVKLYVRMTVHL